MPENFANFAKSSLAAGIIATDTSLSVATGEGARFPVAPFRATIWNATDYVDPADDPDREIVLVTAIAGDTFTTLERGEEGTTAGNHNTVGKTYAVVASITAGALSGIRAIASVTAADVVITGNDTDTPVAGFEVSLEAGTIYAVQFHALVDLSAWPVGTYVIYIKGTAGLSVDFISGFSLTYGSTGSGFTGTALKDRDRITTSFSTEMVVSAIDPSDATEYDIVAHYTISVVSSGKWSILFNQSTSSSESCILRKGASLVAVPM